MKLPAKTDARKSVSRTFHRAKGRWLTSGDDRRPPAEAQPPLDEYYNSLFTAFGPQHWWPGKTQFEVIVGAILTQNTSWTNVERAIANLRGERLLRRAAIERVPHRAHGAP